MTSDIRQLIIWIAENSESESVFLSPNFSWSVNSTDLLDQIVNIFKLSKDEVGNIVDRISDERENANGL